MTGQGTAASTPAGFSSLTVGVEDLEVHADIGVHPHEIGAPQSLLVSVDLEIDPVGRDEIGATIDYTRICALARDLGRTRIALIETFAVRLAETLGQDPRVRSARVRVAKPAALPSGLARITYCWRRPRADP